MSKKTGGIVFFEKKKHPYNGFEKWQGIYTISNSQKQEMYHSCKQI
jgi:hypothetical protein